MNLSVIIPAYNSEKTIDRAIKSVLSQGVGYLELIVIDDGSVDATQARIKKYKNKVKYVRQKNKGVSAARNLGIGLSKNEFIAFLDSDDEWLPGKLKRQTEIFKEHPEVGLTSTGIRSVDENGRLIRDYGVRKNGFVLGRLMEGNFINTSSVVLKRDVLWKISGPFKKGYAYGEDYLLWIELSLRCPFWVIPEPFVNYSEPSHIQFARKYLKTDIVRLYSMIESIVKGKCGSKELNKLRAKMHLELAECNRRLGNREEMLVESVESFKSYPWVRKNQEQILRNLFVYFSLARTVGETK